MNVKTLEHTPKSYIEGAVSYPNPKYPSKKFVERQINKVFVKVDEELFKGF